MQADNPSTGLPDLLNLAGYTGEEEEEEEEEEIEWEEPKSNVRSSEEDTKAKMRHLRVFESVAKKNDKSKSEGILSKYGLVSFLTGFPERGTAVAGSESFEQAFKLLSFYFIWCEINEKSLNSDEITQLKKILGKHYYEKLFPATAGELEITILPQNWSKLAAEREEAFVGKIVREIGKFENTHLMNARYQREKGNLREYVTKKFGKNPSLSFDELFHSVDR